MCCISDILCVYTRILYVYCTLRPVSARHKFMPLAVYNPDYIKWVSENVHDIQYERQEGVIEVGWNKLAKKAASVEPVVVMVTQATVSRYSSNISHASALALVQSTQLLAKTAPLHGTRAQTQVLRHSKCDSCFRGETVPGALHSAAL